MNDVATNPLLGQTVMALDTPALIVDLDVVEANIARIAKLCRDNGVNWRPHVKGNKTVEIVRKELAAGAIGITCAKVGEAEVMAAAGVRSILIANEIVGASKIARLVALQARAEVMVGIDSVANCGPIAAAAERAGVTVPVVIEVNVGMNRAGVSPGAPVVALADAVAAMKGVRLAGLMTWESQAVGIADPAEKARVVQEAVALITASADACRKAGHRIDVVSCGGSGTLPYCTMQPGITEIEAGGAIFSDVLYRESYSSGFSACPAPAGERHQPADADPHHPGCWEKGDEQRRRGARTGWACGGEQRETLGRACDGGTGSAERHTGGRGQGAVRGRLRRHHRASARGDRCCARRSDRGDLAGRRARADQVAACILHVNAIADTRPRRGMTACQDHTRRHQKSKGWMTWLATALCSASSMSLM